MSISTWLSETPHAGVSAPETLVLDELSPPTSELQQYLTQALIEHRASLTVMKDMAHVLGWEAVKRRLQASTVELERGDFGEMLACGVLEEFQLLAIPVRKVRYQLHANQSLIGADVVAFELADDGVHSLHFGEAKLRSTADTSAARDAHAQLEAWHDEEFADVVMFVGSRLFESHQALYDAFIRYLSSQRPTDDRYHIILIWETAKWTDSVLSAIPDPPDQLEPLTVRVVRINDLVGLVEATYARMSTLINDNG